MKYDRALVEIHAAVLLFGLAGLFGKWLVFPAVLIVFGRVVFAVPALAAALTVLRRPLFAGRLKAQALFGLLGLLLAAHWVCFFRSIQVSTVAVGLLSYSTFPLFTAVLEPLMLGEKFEQRAVFLALVCLAGVVLLVPRFTFEESVFRGVLWGLPAGASFSLLSILNRKLRRSHDGLSIAFRQDAFALLFLAPLAVPALPAAISLRDVALLSILGLACTAGAHTLFIDGLRSVSARAASLISALEPVYGIALAIVFLREIPSLRTAAGGALILAAALAVTLSGGKAASSSPPGRA
ncbi:MAG: DMT family transporter [Candidatus Aminicenantes bacterium]|nr:DMT family transporter [Candidatus Aminicenantes bacterium]